MSRDFRATAEAYQRFSKVLADLQDCKALFEAAGEPLPEKLKEFLGTTRQSGRRPDTSVTISAPHRPSRPIEATEEWISIEIGDATATSLALAILRKAGGRPMKAKDAADAVAKINSNIPAGSIYNIGARLDGQKISRNDDGWLLTDQSHGGIIQDGYLWAPIVAFDKTEIAAHRREAIINILKGFTGGLQTLQIVEMLKGNSWVHAPASKDLVKADMELLEAHNKVRRISNSRKWCVRED